MSKVKLKCQKLCFDITVALRSMSKVRVKVKGQGQITGVHQW